jgi:hypothetical protein
MAPGPTAPAVLKPQPAATDTPSASSVPILTENVEKDGYELKFSGKPTEAVLTLFRETKALSSEARWHWHFKKKVWYAKRNEATREFAQLVISRSSGLGEVITPVAAVEPIAPALPVEAAAVAPAEAVTCPVAHCSPDVAAAFGLDKLAAGAPHLVKIDMPSPKFAGGGDPIPLNVEHEQFPKSEWALEVQNGGTRLSYEDWVEAKLDLAAEEAIEPNQELAADTEGNREADAAWQALKKSCLPTTVAAPVPENVILASFTPPEPVRTEPVVTQKSPVPDWRARFSWSERLKQRERGELPGQRNYKG